MQHPVRCGLVVATGIGVGATQLEVVHQQVEADVQEDVGAGHASVQVGQRAVGVTGDVALDSPPQVPGVLEVVVPACIGPDALPTLVTGSALTGTGQREMPLAAIS